MNMNDILGATAEDLILASVEAQDFPIGAYHWSGSVIRRVIRATRRGTLVTFYCADGTQFDRVATGRVMLVAGAKTARMYGRLDFFAAARENMERIDALIAASSEDE